MLSVLSFKRSLFSGVLDDGQDSVFLGKSRLNKFMESVETVTGTIPETANEPSGTEPARLVQRETAPTPGLEPWQDLLTAGTAFLQVLGRNISGGQRTGKIDLTKLIERDEKTGKSCLKIPLPDKQIIQSAIPAINSLLETLKGLID